jgi:hypothetical protein
MKHFKGWITRVGFGLQLPCATGKWFPRAKPLFVQAFNKIMKALLCSQKLLICDD